MGFKVFHAEFILDWGIFRIKLGEKSWLFCLGKQPLQGLCKGGFFALTSNYNIAISLNGQFRNKPWSRDFQKCHHLHKMSEYTHANALVLMLYVAFTFRSLTTLSSSSDTEGSDDKGEGTEGIIGGFFAGGFCYVVNIFNITNGF